MFAFKCFNLEIFFQQINVAVSKKHFPFHSASWTTYTEYEQSVNKGSWLFCNIPLFPQQVIITCSGFCSTECIPAVKNKKRCSHNTFQICSWKKMTTWRSLGFLVLLLVFCSVFFWSSFLIGVYKSGVKIHLLIFLHNSNIFKKSRKNLPKIFDKSYLLR